MSESSASSTERQAGWYGKLPFLGDFAGRRLPTSFIRTWDDWLQNVIYGARSSLGEDWLQRYLNAPIWHFALSPGICGSGAWFGLLMSSVDRANRHFPFTLAHGVPREGLHDAPLAAMVDWLVRLEGEAVAMLDLEGSVQTLEERLAQLAPPVNLDDTRPRIADTLDARFDQAAQVPVSEIPSLLAALAQLGTRADGGEPVSLWWSDAGDGQHAVVWASRSLPTADQYAGMLGS